MTLWLIDPKSKEQSVSLSMLIVSFVAILVGSILEMLGKVGTTSALAELFYACAGLYFGRRFNNTKVTLDSSNKDNQ